MTRTNRKRLKKLSQQIDALPIAPDVEEAAFEKFREAGELPENQRLAAAVCKRALRWDVIRPGAERGDLAANIQRLASIAVSLEAVALQSESESQTESKPLREYLFAEAVYGSDVIRLAARAALKLLVANGRDVTDPQFIPEDMELPDFGSVGLHFLGFPECILKSPYKQQGRRLLRRFADLRNRIDRDDRRWFDDFDMAASRFLDEGELPGDEMMREAVFANGEWTWLLAHFLGVGDVEVMAAFDRAAKAEKSSKTDAIVQMQAMAAQGRLVLPTPPD